MTAAAMQFDPTFSIGPRSTFTWPGALEHSPSSSSMLNDFASITSHGSDVSLTPPSIARSITSSPPRTAFTPEQRELKKQRDLARRDSKLNARMRRTNSQTSSFMDSPPQMPISDATSAMNLPIYSTAPAPLSLLTEPATSMPGAHYMQSYSPPMPDQAGTGPVFPTPYQQAIPSYGMPMEYPTSYPSPSDYSRPSSLPHDSGLMYQVPAVMNTGTSAPEGGHVRVVQSRPKPRCWEHGCNGRQFSTFSNLLRHQREKSGQATKASCPNCGAEFTRTTARNGHLLHDKCKQRRNS